MARSKDLLPGTRVEVTGVLLPAAFFKGIRGTVQHRSGRRWNVQLDQTVGARNVLRWPARRFKIIDDVSPRTDSTGQG